MLVQNDNSQTIKTAHYQLSPSEIQSLNSTPVTLIAAPGTGKYIELISASAFLNHNGTDYSGASLIGLIYSGQSLGVTTNGQLMGSSDFVNSSSDKVQKFRDVGTGGGDILMNTEIVVTSGANFTGAGGTIDVYVQYVVIDTN